MTFKVPALAVAAALIVTASVAAGAAAKPLARNTIYLYTATGENLTLQFSDKGWAYWSPDHSPPQNIFAGPPPYQNAWIEATNKALDDIDVSVQYGGPSGSVLCSTVVPVTGNGDSGSCSASGGYTYNNGPYQHGKSAYWCWTIAKKGDTTDACPSTELRPAYVASAGGACGTSGTCTVKVINPNATPVTARVHEGRGPGYAGGASPAAATRLIALRPRSSQAVALRLSAVARSALVRRGRVDFALHVRTYRDSFRVVRTDVIPLWMAGR